MSTSITNDQQVANPPVNGNVVGFADTELICNKISTELVKDGIDVDRITWLSGKDGWDIFNQRMQGYSWGEESEQVMRVGERELASGHFVLFVAAKERDEGMRIAQIAQAQGGHGLRHFGELTDERLTS